MYQESAVCFGDNATPFHRILWHTWVHHLRWLVFWRSDSNRLWRSAHRQLDLGPLVADRAFAWLGRAEVAKCTARRHFSKQISLDETAEEGLAHHICRIRGRAGVRSSPCQNGRVFFAEYAFFSKPPVIPELFDPALDIGAGLATFFGVPVAGNWWLILFWLGWLAVNIGGEELLGRGCALPLQERVFGRYAWLVNGICWNLLIHAFMKWNFLTLMPISLAIPFLVQRYKNTWIGIYIHGLGNLMVLVILIPSIAGWV